MHSDVKCFNISIMFRETEALEMVWAFTVPGPAWPAGLMGALAPRYCIPPPHPPPLGNLSRTRGGGEGGGGRGAGGALFLSQSSSTCPAPAMATCCQTRAPQLHCVPVVWGVSLLISFFFKFLFLFFFLISFHCSLLEA